MTIKNWKTNNMAALPKELTITVKQQNISVVEGKPGDLFVMKLGKPVSKDVYQRLNDHISAELTRKFPGSRLMILPHEVDGIPYVSEEDTLKEIRNEERATPPLGINPNNTHQGRVFFDMFMANDVGENRHPVTVVEELSKTLGFKILDRVPQSLFDGWDFWIEFDKPPKLPDYFRAGIKWKRIGEA